MKCLQSHRSGWLTISTVARHTLRHAVTPAGEHVVAAVAAVVREDVAGAALLVVVVALLGAGVGPAAEQTAGRAQTVLRSVVDCRDRATVAR